MPNIKSIVLLLRSSPVLIVLLFFALGICSGQGAVTHVSLYVSVDGKVGNDGSQSSPLTLSAAVQAVEKMAAPLQATIYMAAGTYYFDSSLIIFDPARDPSRGISFLPVGGGKVVFSGGKLLQNSSFKPVTDPQTLTRVPAAARGKLYYTNLASQGIGDYGKMAQHGAHRINPSLFQLYCSTGDLRLARWPNTGQVDIGTVLDPGPMQGKAQKGAVGAKFLINTSRMKNWTTAGDIWLSGYFSYGYTDDNVEVDSLDIANSAIRIKQPTDYGVFSTADSTTAELKNGRSTRGFYVYNLLEELDEPGEWWLDRQSGLLYLWPPGNAIGSGVYAAAMLEDPLVVVDNACNISFKGVTFSTSRGMGLFLQKTSHVSVQDCEFSNLGTVAISTSNQFTPAPKKYPAGSGGSNYNDDLTVDGCKLFNTGTGGITLEGGDRKNLISASNTVSNCEIHHFSGNNRTYAPAVTLDGVGNVVRHCYIHDAPGQAITFQGNDHKIEYNHIANVVSFGTDISAVYTGRDPSAAGTSISFNFFDRIGYGSGGSVAAIYFDDGTGGAIINSNIFYKANAVGLYGFGAIYINGGSNTVLSNNYFIDCQKALSDAAWTDKQWSQFINRPDIVSKISKDQDIHSAAYRKYRGLAAMVDSVSPANRKNYSYNTLAYKVARFSTAKSFTNSNVDSISSDPGFRNLATGDFTLVNPPAALSNAKDWKPVPFSLIGIQSGK